MAHADQGECVNKNAERGTATRERLLEVATRLFAARGYEGTSVDAVLRESNLSKGSLYHHYRGKDELFRAVLEEVEQRTGAQVAEAARVGGDAVGALREGCLAWIRLAEDPVVRQIVLIDAPAVLGWARWRAMEEEHTLGLVKAALVRVADAGGLPRAHVTTFAHVILAAVNEIAQLIARADDPAEARAQAEASLTELLNRLFGK